MILEHCSFACHIFIHFSFIEQDSHINIRSPIVPYLQLLRCYLRIQKDGERNNPKSFLDGFVGSDIMLYTSNHCDGTCDNFFQIYWRAILDPLSWQWMRIISLVLVKEGSKEKIEG
ncbi:hypothetical protein SAY87_032156 [Trapa incisa]|uniref:Uncharacterized protein n=1 Tax=Trapa incisa TaxID=236973 RepID=A0AAN7KSB3_9MYRT|nr:hypothetical protein SAY87_032156 [Trapa incisa]